MLSCSCTAATKLNTTAVRFFFCFSKVNCLFGFSSRTQRDSSMAAFVTVHSGSYGRLKEKYFYIFALPLPPQNEMQLLSGFCCYSNLVCLFGFGVEKSVATCSSKVKVEHAHLVTFRSCTNLVPRVFRLFRQLGNAWKTLGTSNLNRRNPAVSVVLRMPQFLNGSKILRAVRDSEGAMFHVKCFRKVATATLHEIYPSFSEEQESLSVTVLS